MMTKYVLVDSYGKYNVVESNFPYPGAVCEAPAEAGRGDGDLLDIVDVGGMPFAIINEERKAAKEAAKAANEVAKKWLFLRNRRDSLLAQSDWTQYPDVTMSDDKKLAWKTYRQALRDLPFLTEDPSNPEWPVKPS